MAKSRAIFLDRDGTLIREWARHPDDVCLLPGVVAGLENLQDAGYLLIVVSNQADVGRGKTTRIDADLVHDRFIRCMERRGIHMTATYYCYHTPADNCGCRKPRPGLLVKAQHDHNIDMSRSWMVGDRRTDIIAGIAAHIYGVYHVGHDGNFTNAVGLIRGST